MMKKLLSGALLLAAMGTANAQTHAVTARRVKFDPQILNASSGTNGQASKTASITGQGDTLWYFFNKYKFKETAAMQNTGLSFAPGTAIGTSTNGDLVEFGSSFLNPSNAPITISGALLLIARWPTSVSASIPVRVYIYNANSAGMPTTKVDSVTIGVSNTGGNFNIATFTTPRTVNGSFFISYRIISTSLGDTLVAAMTGAADLSNTAVAANMRYGEGLSYTRFHVANPAPAFDTLIVNTDFLFGTGFDPEALVVPMVSYSINANYTVSAPSATSTPGSYCTNQAINFTNTTNPNSIVYGRQFNFNAFVPYWAPSTWGFSITPTASPINNWTFSNNSAVTLTTTNASNSFVRG